VGISDYNTSKYANSLYAPKKEIALYEITAQDPTLTEKIISEGALDNLASYDISIGTMKISIWGL
jgi:hypothetical protein